LLIVRKTLAVHAGRRAAPRAHLSLIAPVENRSVSARRCTESPFVNVTGQIVNAEWTLAAIEAVADAAFTTALVHRLQPLESMNPHPIQLRLEHAPHMDRAHVVIRLILLIALGAVGCSSVYWMLYLTLPAFAAMRISQTTAQRYLADDGPRIARALKWLAGAYAYLWLLTDVLPSSNHEGVVDLEMNPSGTPTTSTALLRLVTTLPALLMLAALSVAAGLLWPVGAVFVLVGRRMPDVLFDFFLLTLRGQFRCIAYHLSLVDRYPSFEETVATGDAPHSGAI
jgi:hypothetical protein